MKLFKNKKNKALVAAVTMSLVMGVCGNALAVTTTIENTTFNGNVCAVNIILTGSALNGIVNIRNATVNRTVTGGSAGKRAGNAYANTVNIENSTIKENVFGGYAISGAANNNVVNLSNSVVTGKVEAVYAREEAWNNIVNVDSNVRVDGTVYGMNSPYGDDRKRGGNNLNVHGISNVFGGIAHFNNINVDILDKDCKMLSVKDAINLGGFATFNAVNSKNYKTGTTLTLLYSDKTDFTKLAKDKLRIDGEAKEEIAIDKSGLSEIKDIKAIDAAVGFDVLPNAINFVTKYKLVDNLNVADDINLSGVLNLNNKTLNMQQKTEEAAQYNTVTAKRLTGEGNLAIDVDMSGGIDNIKNDKICISSDGVNDAIINISSVIVRKDLQSTLSGKEEVKGAIKAVEGNVKGITFKADSIKTATSNYVYLFTLGNDGEYNFIQRPPGTLADFIQGEGNYTDINTFTLNMNEVAERNLVTTDRKNSNKDITLAFNKGISLSGDKKKYEGITVADGYTFKLQGEDKSDPGKVTQFKTAAVTVNAGGTLEVTNMKFEGNEKDIVNNGTLKLTGTNTVHDISNAGTADIGGTNTITQISNTGTAAFNGTNTINDLSNANTVKLNGSNTIGKLIGIGATIVEGGKTTVNNSFEQTAITVNSGAGLELKNKAVITDTLTNAGTVTTRNSTINELANTGTVTTRNSTINELANTGKVYLYDANTLTTVNGEGYFCAHGKTVTVNGAFRQEKVDITGRLLLNDDSSTKDLYLKNGAELVANNLTVTNSLKNNGTITMNGISDLPKVYRDNSYGIFNVNAGISTINGSFTQNEANVSGGKLVLKDAGDVQSMNVKSNGALEIGNTLKVNSGLKNDGTVIMNSSKDNTLNSVTGTGTFNVEQGKTTVSGAFNQKEVNVNAGGTLKLTGGQDSFVEGTTQGHTVNVDGGNIASYIYGGCSKGDAYENTVNINKATVQGEGAIKGDVYGGCTAGNAYKNIVNIDGSTVHGDVYGGLTFNNGTAYQNTVNIVNSTINGNVYGGINNQGDNNRHYENVVSLAGSTVGGFVYGASDLVESNNLLRVNGSNSSAVKAGNIAYFQKLEFNLPEGYNRNNALLTLGYNEATSESAIIAQDTSLNLNGLNEESAIVVKSSSPNDVLKKGDQVTLIHKNEGSLEIKNNGQNIFNQGGIMNTNGKNMAVYMASLTYILRGKLQLDEANNNLIFVAGSHASEKEVEDLPEPDAQPEMARMLYAARTAEPGTEPNLTPDLQPGDLTGVPDPGPVPGPRQTGIPDIDTLRNELLDNIKTAMETRANAAALLNEGSDFLMGQGLSNAVTAAKESKAEGNSSMAPFAALGGGKLRYETGSHIDSKSWQGAVGLAKEVKGLTFGVAVQQGKSKYDAYVNKAHSEGNSKSVGGALFAEKKTSDGLHFETALRAGRIKNDYNAQLEYTGIGVFGMHYKESSAFYGLSLGGGKEFTLKNKDKVDVYGRYSWMHAGSSDVTTEYGDGLNFNAIDSHRIMLGGRYTHAVNERNEVYAGLGWQYELGGKVKGTTTSCGYDIRNPEPSLKGSSGMLELGWKVAAEENFTVDFNVNGWTGKQRGVMGGVNMQWKF